MLLTSESLSPEALEHADAIIFLFSYDEIFSLKTGRIIDALLTLSDSDEYFKKFTSKVSFGFDGVDNDEREVYEIPECVTLFRKVTHEWPFWFHFIEKSGITMSIMMMLLCDTEKTGDEAIVNGQKVYGARIKRKGDIHAAMSRLFAGMNHLYAYHDVASEIEHMTAVVSKTYDNMSHPSHYRDFL